MREESWDKEALAALRGAVYRRNGRAVLEALTCRALEGALQLAGDGLLASLAQGLVEAAEPAASCARALRERDDPGDGELAAELEAALGVGPPSSLRPLPVDLDQLSSVLEGDPLYGGGRIDLESGEVWPASLELDEEDEEEMEDEERWLYVECRGSREGYRDMEEFIETVADPHLAELLDVTISGPGVFRRFKDVLARRPEELERWYAFSEDRRLGRARVWLAVEGYRPDVPSSPRPEV